MNPSEKAGRIAGWLLQLAMKLPGARGALRHLLSRDGERLLREQLSLCGIEALISTVIEGDPKCFGAIVRARGCEPLGEAIFAEDAALLRQLLRQRGAEALLPVLESLEEVKRGDLGRALLFAGQPHALERLSHMDGFLEEVLGSPRLHAMATLLDTWVGLCPLLSADDPDREARLGTALRSIEKAEQARGVVLDLITKGDIVRLTHGTLRFPCRHSLWTLMHEILLNEDYYFESDSDTPHIIDGGAHLGMAIYYFKSRYPNACITAFEPHPELHALAAENVARNGWEGVKILPHALAGTRREAIFHISESWSMAGSLSERRATLGDTVRDVTVQCVPLSDYLRAPVDFLKLDIEGAEDEVLEEAAPWLHNVANIFCEFHQGAGLSSGRLARILAVLEQANFDVQVGKSHNYQERSRWRPLTHFDGAASMVIWARRRRD